MITTSARDGRSALAGPLIGVASQVYGDRGVVRGRNGMLGFVVRRLRGRLPLAGAVLLTVLITTAVLTALVAFNRTVGEAGLRQALQGDGHARTTVLVSGEHGLDKRSADDAAVAAYGGGLFGGLAVRTESLARSRSYGLPAAGAPAAAPAAATPPATPPSGQKAAVDLTLLASLDRGRVHLLAGGWPAAVQRPAQGAAAGPVEVAVPQTTLTRLGLAAANLPADVRLDDRYDGRPLTVRVTGVYRADDPATPYWGLDTLGGREIQTGGFTTYGPLLVDDSAFTTAVVPQNGRSWLLGADFAGIRDTGAAAVRDRAAGLADDLTKATGLQVRTELPVMLGEVESSALVARSTLLIGALQLAVLAAAVLLLVVQLMAARQEGENALLAARGASGARLGLFSATEALLLAVPAAALAPLFTPLLLSALAHRGPLARVPLDTGLSWTLWPIATGCALACVLLTTVPTVLRGAGSAVLRRAGRRQALVANAVRSGADLAVVGLAALAYYQLAQYEGGLSTDASGRLGLDPVLVAAPTLALGAGTLLVLRLLPFAARLGGRIAARGRGLVPALAGWQLARRPGRATGPVLLLVLAVSTGVLALGQQRTWSESQRDQADFATAGGLRITGSQLASMGQGGRYGALPGGDRLIPVIRQEHTLPAGATGQVLALDAAGFADRVPVRPDLLGGQHGKDLFGPLAQPAPTGAAAGLPLPGHPARIDIDLVNEPSAGAAGATGAAVPPDVWLLVRDRFGDTYRVRLTGVPVHGRAVATADLAALTAAPVGAPAAPLTVAGLVVVFGTDQNLALTGELDVQGIAVADTATGPATAVPAPAGLTWRTSTAPGESGSGSELLPARDGRVLGLRYAPKGRGTGVVTQATLLPAGTEAPDVLPALATRGYLAGVGADVGDTVQVTFGSVGLRLRITGAVDSLPVAGDKAVVVDLAAAGRLFAAGGRQLPDLTEWWLPATGPGDRVPAEAAAALRATPGVQRLLLNDEVAAGLLADPLSAAPQSALAAIALASTVLAAIGFAAAAAASARERAADFTVLLALGTPRRWLVRTAAAEQAVLVLLGSLAGLGLGALIVRLIVPFVVLTPAARRPTPEALVVLPLGWALLLTAAIAAVPLLSVFLIGRRRRDVAARLRHVEEM
ncbi:FtsX-like permease family protein [Kitasatospora sp. NPDC047058]|uniref:FtsX-like permease family protein n=1 Tax=Kitasatospora sp. NPDC047058 TaxID=3155620 RepID=UPI0033C4B40E